jgi:Flp pilus assembly pilin Flp
MLKAFLNDENGAIVSAEIVLVITILVIGVIVGLSEVAVAVNTELNDVSNAIGALNQSFSFCGFLAADGGKTKSYKFGTRFTDTIDDCDKNASSDLVCHQAAHCDEGNSGTP